MERDPETLLHSVFGFEQFRPLQKQVVDHVMDGGDALVLMPTGGGKSLCYQIPAMARGGTGIVVSPLIALMDDQVAALVQSGVRAACLHSGLAAGEARAIEQELLTGELDLLYVAPERLLTPRMQELLQRAEPALFAIDEAHCVSQWGHDFRPEYLQLAVLGRQWPHVPRLALTATADPRTREEILERLEMPAAERFISSFDRPNIRYRVTEKKNARQQLKAFLENEQRGNAGIVYCLSRKKVDDTAEWLQGQGWEALPYHAGLSAEQRRRHQDRFLSGDAVIMVATIAFGMGIDKPDVRFVAHLDLPRSLEAYYQETGRAGRDGLPADAWLVYGLQDVILLRQMIESSGADAERRRVERQKLEDMLGFCELANCRRQALLAHFGETDHPPCGNCDTCQEPPETWDATDAARKALSCVWRTGQRFGVTHLVNVLQGADQERIRQLGHDRLSTWGIGEDMDTAQWRGVFRQLVAHGLLTVDPDGYGALRLTEQCRPVLRGETRLTLRLDRKPRKAGRRQRQPGEGLQDAASHELFEALRACRRRLAEEQGIPPYMVFHDSTLMEMVAARPETREALAAVNGVGEHKLERYGDEFLEAIREVITS
ncbi:DNA helicase RecQ [Aquisalimonas lutea]|uniref:DNA helicase RecQ n=1 Tax=Aquisalimonas lutea TaxID=1327750 RepID=UPI0025B2E4BD|nr:DNA helicase RecQ [Aquisalimonas lutea]MDN3518676.1 DNA helicase RecQ [Aquisalimonas lutea]